MPAVRGNGDHHKLQHHVFTRFVRKLYHPHKALAGPKMAGKKNPYI